MEAVVRSFTITYDVYVILNAFKKYDNKRPDPICRRNALKEEYPHVVEETCRSRRVVSGNVSYDLWVQIMAAIKLDVQDVLLKKKNLILGDKAAQARQLLRKSLREYPDSIEIKEALGQLLNSKSMRHEGISILEEVIQAKRGRISNRTLGCLTTLYFDTRRFEDCIRMAKRILNRAVSKEKTFIETHVRTQLVMAYAFSGSWRKAKYEFERLPLDVVLFEDRGYWQYGDIKSLIENGLEKIGESKQKRNKFK